jgi:hypothetical protein
MCYFVVQCGNPSVTGICRECGSTIGGNFESLAPGNRNIHDMLVSASHYRLFQKL